MAVGRIDPFLLGRVVVLWWVSSGEKRLFCSGEGSTVMLNMRPSSRSFEIATAIAKMNEVYSLFEVTNQPISH